MATCDTIISGVVAITVPSGLVTIAEPSGVADITVPDGAVTIASPSGLVAIVSPDGADFNVYNASEALLDEEGNPTLDELACSIKEE